MASVVTDAALAWAAANWSPLAQLLAGEIAANQASYVAGSAASVAFQLGRITAAAYATTTTAVEAAYANALSVNWLEYYDAAIGALTTRETTGQEIERDVAANGQIVHSSMVMSLLGSSLTWVNTVSDAGQTAGLASIANAVNCNSTTAGAASDLQTGLTASSVDVVRAITAAELALVTAAIDPPDKSGAEATADPVADDPSFDVPETSSDSPAANVATKFSDGSTGDGTSEDECDSPVAEDDLPEGGSGTGTPPQTSPPSPSSAPSSPTPSTPTPPTPSPPPRYNSRLERPFFTGIAPSGPWAAYQPDWRLMDDPGYMEGYQAGQAQGAIAGLTLIPLATVAVAFAEGGLLAGLGAAAQEVVEEVTGLPIVPDPSDLLDTSRRQLQNAVGEAAEQVGKHVDDVAEETAAQAAKRADDVAAEGVEEVPEEVASDQARRQASLIDPDKFKYIFGDVTTGPHNTARSLQNAAQMNRIGISNTPEGRELLTDHLRAVASDPTNVARSMQHTLPDGRIINLEIRESLLAGPGGVHENAVNLGDSCGWNATTYHDNTDRRITSGDVTTMHYPTSQDFLGLFGIEPIEKDDLWTIQLVDRSGIELIITFCIYDGSFQTVLRTNGRVVASVSHEGLTSMKIEGGQLVAEFTTEGCKVSASVSLEPHIHINWSGLRTT